MSDEKSDVSEKGNTPEKSDTPVDAPVQKAEPSIQVIAQYVKDISFENPHAPESLVGGWPPPETNVQISLAQKHIKDNSFESSLHFRIEAKNKQDNRMAFILDLHYGALVALNNIPKESQQAVLMVEVPKLLFPFIREIVASKTSQGGYPPLYLTPISFEAIYVNEIKRKQAEKNQQTGTA
ncbi:MAG: protein-export chaperone SecB [Alphaproteobacteria bacterium]|nr:protein-export chaperone SecB [Alphaproteobacteria bacterium]MCK5555342.1 protein-export chaperone SecB [Alphaproteobacteria bacterium]